MLTNSLNDQNRPCRVMVRCRPLSRKQTQQSNPLLRQKIVRKNEHTLYLYEPDVSESTPMRFNFDKIFLEADENLNVFEGVNEVVDDLLKGYHTAILAYGITGAGKSYTMFGGQKQQGLVALILRYLLGVGNIKVKLSLMELYNQQLRDLLAQNSHGLSILEDSQGNIVIPELSWHELQADENPQNIIKIGISKRVTANTSSNTQSSRSHCIIQVAIEQSTSQGTTSSKLFLVDLAGSQKSTQNRGLRLQEGANINKSLLSLSNCIIQLSENSPFVSYRDSKLTRLLKECLGGNSKTVIIACISPSYLTYDETVNTLKYASKAARIRREIVPNTKNDDKSQVQFLRREIAKLREMLKQNTRPLSPQPRRQSSLLKTPKNVSPTSTRARNRLERENELLRNSLKQRQNEVREKDELIKRLTRQLCLYRQNSSLQLKEIKQNISVPNQSKIRKIDVKRSSEIPILEIARLFKNKLKSAYEHYQSLAKKDRLPPNLIDLIQELVSEYSQSNVILSKEYTNCLWELKKLADLSMH